MTERYKIYGLFDPRSPDEILYVGATRKPLFIRLKDHLQETKAGRLKCEWVKELKKDGLIPGIIELEECDGCEASFVEARWIGNFSATMSGNRIKNRTLPHFKRGDHFLNQRLKNWRGEQLQKTAADIMQVPLPTYRNWEYGANVPGFIAMKEIDRVISKPIIDYPQADKSIVHEPVQTQWCDELKAWRKKFGIVTKKEAASKLSVSYQVYQQWEDYTLSNPWDIERCKKTVREMMEKV